MKNSSISPLEKLELQRSRVKEEIRQSENRIARHWDSLTTPPPETTVVQKYVNKAEKAYVIYDGVMLGYKLCKRFNRFAGLFKKKKNNRKS